MRFIDEFKDFMVKGNVVDLAVAFVMGAAFNSLIGGMVADIITPLIGVPGHFDFASLQYTVNGSTFLVGTFINSLISFILIAAVVFFLIVKPMTRLKKPAAPGAPVTKECPQCLSQIPAKAKRCAFCTSKVK